MASLLSPGVISREIDLTTATPAVATTEGGIALDAQWGPAEKLVLVTDEVDLVDVFGKPNDANAARWFTAKNFLSYSGALYVSRALSSTALNSTDGSAGYLLKNKDDFESKASHEATAGKYAARYPGELGNSLKIVIVDWSIFDLSSYSSNFQGKPDKDELHVLVIDEDGLISGSKGSVLEKFEYLSKFGDAKNEDGTSNYYKKVVNDSSEYVYILDIAKASFGADTSDWVEYNSTTGLVEMKTGQDQADILLATYLGDSLPEAILWAEGDSYDMPDGMTVTLTAGETYTEADGTAHPHDSIIGTVRTPAGDGVDDGIDSASATNFEISLDHGVDGTVNNAGLSSAYDEFADEELVDISFLIGADGDATIANKIFEIASSRQDCIGTISPLYSDVSAADPMTEIKSYRESLNVGGLKDLKGSFMVMDDNWKYQFDKYNNVNRWVPCNGDTAGLMAETDLERAAWFSPGGRGLKNVIKLAWKSKKAERDVLYPLGINSITTFPGEGAILYGDRTMLRRPSAFDRINVRRLFIVLRKTISRTARSFLFENNTSYTRERFKSTIIPFLEEVQGRQGITDFLVVCDETNNTGQVIDQNRFIGDIYIKPARSINFIELNFVAVRTDVEFSEVVGSV